MSLFHCFIAYIFIVLLLLLLCFVQRMSDCTKLFYVYNYNMSCIILLYCGSYILLYFSLIEFMKNDQKTKQLSTFREEIRIRGRCASVPNHVYCAKAVFLKIFAKIDYLVVIASCNTHVYKDRHLAR